MSYFRLLVFLGLAVGSPIALSAQTFSFDYVTSSDFASGSFTAVNEGTLVNGSTEYLVTSISGSLTFGGSTYSITSLLAPGSLKGNDDIVYGSGGAYTPSPGGIAFTTSSGSSVVFDNTSEFVSGEVDSGTHSVNGYLIEQSSSSAAAPWEPSDFVVLSGAALFGIQQLRRRKKTLKAD